MAAYRKNIFISVMREHRTTAKERRKVNSPSGYKIIIFYLFVSYSRHVTITSWFLNYYTTPGIINPIGSANIPALVHGNTARVVLPPPSNKERLLVRLMLAFIVQTEWKFFKVHNWSAKGRHEWGIMYYYVPMFEHPQLCVHSRKWKWEKFNWGI